MGFFLDFRQRLVATMDRIFGDAENRNLFLINDGPNIFTIERLVIFPSSMTINDLNLMNNLAILENLKTRALNN